jgi:hypothetical protein
MKTGCPAFRPGVTVRPWPVFHPGNIAGEMPPIDDKVRTAYDGKRQRILREKQEWQQIHEAVHECRKGPLYFLTSHPLALQQVIAYRMRN